MTFCIGIKVRQGLLALADTRIVKGEEHLTKSKLCFSSNGERRWWLVTSGLRSIRDKAVAYFEREITEHTQASDYEVLGLASGSRHFLWNSRFCFNSL